LPLDGAQYANISSNLKQTTSETMQGTTAKWKIYRTPTVEEKKFKPIASKPLLFSFLLKNKTRTHKLRNSRGKKNR
jgi:hypothetical protein